MHIGNNGQSFGQDLWFGYCYLGSLFLVPLPAIPLFVKGTTGYQMAQVKKLGV